MDDKTINIEGKIYQASPETNICDGCAFQSDNGDDRCIQAHEASGTDCLNIVWKHIALKTGSAMKQVGGSHYQKAIQPWDIIREWKLDYWRGNVVKYVLRCNEKNGIEDLKKAIHYLEYAIENYEEDIK